MASDSDMDEEDYYIVEDANESVSSEYVPCINYTNDKVEDIQKMKRMVGLGLRKILVPQIFNRFEGSWCNYLNLNNYTPGAVFDEFF